MTAVPTLLVGAGLLQGPHPLLKLIGGVMVSTPVALGLVGSAGLCDRIGQRQSYGQLADGIRADFNTSDEHMVSYLLSQAAQELCPAQIWQLRQSAVGYRPPAV